MSMDFIDQVKQFSKRVESLKDNIQTEEATKTAIIMPFFALLGYDVFDPSEFIPEFTADVGIKKGEKVDYAIVQDGNPTILIEAKWIGEKLEKHDSQLFRYFGTTSAKFGILTNGLNYRFFTDLEEANKMDEKPFFEFNILSIKDNQVSELKKFHKSVFNLSDVFDTASELKYVAEFKNTFLDQLQNPSDDLVRYFLSSIYPGVKTQSVIEKFRPVLKKSLNNTINEMMNDKIKNALDVEGSSVPEVIEEEIVELEPASKIKTTNDELEAYFLIKNMLKDIIDPTLITYKDTESYMGILYKSNVRKWICRIVLTPAQKTLYLPDAAKKDAKKYIFTNLYELEQYKDEIVEIVQRYI